MLKIAKQQACQKFVYKIHSSRLRQSKWDLTLSIDEARRNGEVISLADSQMLRWIDELKGTRDADMRAKAIKSEIRHLRKEEGGVKNRNKIKKLCTDLDELQFIPEYLCVIMDKNPDYKRAVRGFSINGIKYRRLLGTNGGIKHSTIVFVADNLADELLRRIENGRNQDNEVVTAKYEAHKALVCSASIPVSMPNGILVVPDVETTFRSNITYITDEADGEPVMGNYDDQEVTIDASDGCGLILPTLAERWSEELGLDYLVSGVNTRFAFEKGMAFTFDFIDFADKVAGGKYIVKDAWGDDVDIRNVEIILTTSMVKLWDSYDSCESYVRNSLDNGYTFGVAKTCPKELESERNLNYQFIQPYVLSDEEVDELIKPTMDEIKDVLGGDWRKTLLFMLGSGLKEDNVWDVSDDITRAIMADPKVMDDPYVRNIIFGMIHKRIDRAKIGVLKVHGNFSMISGDPYSLCQSIFGLEVTGLLKAGEIYNRYWQDYGNPVKLACYRAPMSCANNIRIVNAVSSDEMDYWYRYMETCTIINSWDTMQAALNGADMDGDMVLLTDNRILVEKIDQRPALMCVQRKAEKCIPTQDDFVESNIASFGDDIGKITNRITSMYELLSHFEPESKEYKMLDYRIQCGQLYQQNAIDKAKGIICKPMPKEWYDRHTVNKIEDENKRSLYRSIVADRKPYFMRHVYPTLSREYRTYVRNANKSAYREFGLSVDELQSISPEDLTDEQRDFLFYYDYRMPVGLGDYTMNKICRRFEEEFDRRLTKPSEPGFDYTILKGDGKYNTGCYRKVKALYDEYTIYSQQIAIRGRAKYDTEEETREDSIALRDLFIEECITSCCSNESDLCDVLLDICYKKGTTKKIAWDMCGSRIVENLLSRHNYELSFPEADDNGDIKYGGKMYSLKTVRVGED